MTVSVPEIPTNRRPLIFGLVLFGAILLTQIVALRLMGRVWICTCGDIKLWENEIFSSGNSQHIADWYTPSHILHGFAFYGLTWLVLRNQSFGLRLGVAAVIEAGWEILENTPLIIERYRAATISLDYFGDSILNSAFDTLFMAVGFLLASRLPVIVTLGLAIATELTLAFLIRDNLTLNILMLVWPVDSIKLWQGGL